MDSLTTDLDEGIDNSGTLTEQQKIPTSSNTTVMQESPNLRTYVAT